MRIRVAVVAGLLALVPVLSGASEGAPRPPDTVVVDPGGGSIELWPYTGTDFSGAASDPVNLFFLDADPRAIRKALLGLNGNRTSFGFPSTPPFDCRWADAMGSEHTSWAETRRWVGSEVQVACVHEGAPLGDPFRFHLRLFRQGPHTIGAAHFEIKIPGTGEHAVLSWELAEQLVVADLARTGTLTAPPALVPLFTPAGGSFRTVLRPVFDGVAADPAGAALLASLGLVAPSDPSADVPIPTDGVAVSLAPALVYHPRPESTRAEAVVDYDVLSPRPFCGTGPYDVVHLGGPVRFVLTSYTDLFGNYSRFYAIDGALSVTPIDPLTGAPSGATSPARVQERHAALLTRHSGQLRESASQVLLADPTQSLSWVLDAGLWDRYTSRLVCE